MSTHESHKTLRRSRSPIEHPSDKKRRSRSPRTHLHHHHHRHHHHHSSKKKSRIAQPIILPFQASPLSKHDFDTYKPMFGLYLEIQKQLVIEELADSEVRGRWKSFVGKWNGGELAEGWYDSATLRKAQASAAKSAHVEHLRASQNDRLNRENIENAGESSDESTVGPALPSKTTGSYKLGTRSGPVIPSLQDLDLQREMMDEDFAERRETLQQDRILDRKQQKERLDELVPRAEAGSKDRMLEKKREKAESNHAFASAKTEAGVEDIPEVDLFGGEDGGIEGLQKQKRDMDRKKNERELRREEMLRTRREEREQRVKEYQAKEEKTMSGLVALAKARFG